MTKSEKLKQVIESWGCQNVRVEWERESDVNAPQGYYAAIGENEHLTDYLGWDFDTALVTAERYYKSEPNAGF